MAGRDVPAASAAITVDGTAAGYVTVGSSTPFYAGAQVFLRKDDGSVHHEARITDLGASNTIGLLFANAKDDYITQADKVLIPVKTPGPRYGRSACSTVIAADGWTLYQPSQFIYGA